MLWLTVFGLLALGVLLVGHFGLPERPVPPPGKPQEQQIMQGAEPWRFEGKSGVAFVVSHGFAGSAFNTRPLGEFIHSLGHTAIGVLLPGHGTRIEDMNESRYEHWREHLERVYLEERGRYEHLFLIGFSMGGTLCLDIAARNADSFRPAGIVTISSPVFFNGIFNGRLVLHSPGTMVSGILKHVQPVLSRGGARAASLDRMNPWVGYRDNHPMVALHSFKRAFRSVRSGLPRISAPYCNIMAANDRTVSAENQNYIFHHVHSREKRALMFTLPSDLSTMHSLLTHQRAAERVFRFIETFVQDVLARYREPKTQEQPHGPLAKLRSLFSGSMSRKADNLVRD